MENNLSGFEELGLPRQYLNAIEEMGYTIPTPVQQKAIPIIRSGQHVIGIAQTGTGKTAAYLLPVMQNLKFAQGELPRAVILVPTKELVLQVLEQVQLLGKYTDLRSVGLYGGVGRKKQAETARAGVDIVVSTPMRLLELYQAEPPIPAQQRSTFHANRCLPWVGSGQIRSPEWCCGCET